MCAMEEQARRGLAESGLKLRAGHLPEAHFSNNKFDPVRAEQTGKIAENKERRRQKLAGRPTDLNRDCILATCSISAPRKCSLAVVRSVSSIGPAGQDNECSRLPSIPLLPPRPAK